ncbi:Tetratricopeptide repeat (TPR)-like superfamily protein [Abeliophyllum distichum]|uniref:Tetratricopeptide repeat (TPR)-like superfamily protein n=1 Tax=Abeliophyllum distichum TaxID=126358 RepID=A0ABD1VRK3_9LAMI
MLVAEILNMLVAGSMSRLQIACNLLQSADKQIASNVLVQASDCECSNSGENIAGKKNLFLMEKLKSVIPAPLRQIISESNPDDLPFTCTSLLNFFNHLPLFHQMVRDLTDPEMGLCGKNKEAALEAKAKGNECFSKGDYPNALRFYSQALRVAPTDAEDVEKNLVGMLYVNRAAALHKMGLFLECLRDSSRALIISPSSAKAWFRRAKANASLGNNEDAIQDLNLSLNMETSLSGKRQIQSELRMILDQSKQTSDTLEKPNDDNLDILGDEPLQIKLQSVPTPTKGRGMVSLTDIPRASLIHKEDPYAAIILKPCRETHCHFCFNELPADMVPCASCSIPLYCSLQCQPGGQDFGYHLKRCGFPENLSDDLQDHVRRVTSLSFSSNNDYIAEHRHECHGVHWPAVLPSDVVLAGRVIRKHIHQQGQCSPDSNMHGILDLCHNYGQLSPERKLELHIYSIILSCCLEHVCQLKLPISSVIASQIVILLSQIRVNSMAIVRMKFSDLKEPLEQARTCSVEQVRVGQAVYSVGSLFNHSCQPNVHAYFLSRTLYVRATEFVATGYQLELSYGPQVGQFTCKDRQQLLEDRYSFICQCSGCAHLNLSDLVLSAYQCNKPNCFGVVLDSCVCKYEKQKLNYSCCALTIPRTHKQTDMLNDDINKVARRVFEQTCQNDQFEPGHCWSCGSYCDLQASQKTIIKAETYVSRLQEAVASNEIPTNALLDALKSVGILRMHLHSYNKRIAEVEDNVAQAFCLVGELQAALDHCQASVEVLEKLYDPNHIVVGNELIKLVSVQLSMGCDTASDNIDRLAAIFSRYYGSHAEIIFPHLHYLKERNL